MGIGFGRVVVNGAILADPYTAGVETLPRFEVISDSGPRYRIEQIDRRRWSGRRSDSAPNESGGTVLRGGNVLNRWYSYTRKGHFFSGGHQRMFINAVFGLIGELDGDRLRPSPTP
ncbi:hypothetical protein [Herbiconiux liukaitaii]|uniref:hypothetical protein n=1 Tax=Herbiconiux liukaitaii TaxID=3342799 RepID=UPI0035BAE4E4